MFSIDHDREKFRKIVRSKIKEDLRKYMSQEGFEIYGKSGKHKIRVPIPRISIPKFTWGDKGGGVGQGNEGGGGDGNEDNPLEVDVSLEEMANLLSEELELPRIEPKGKSQVELESHKYRTTRTSGPESLKIFKKTYFQALRRQIMCDEYDLKNPVILPIKEDKRYRASKPLYVPNHQCVVFYLMDVSGSMGEQQKELARLTSFWIDLWLRSQYKNITSRYIIHHHDAKEVDQHTFYHTHEGGGTRISSAYALTKDIIKIEFPPDDWNIYIFQYSDGEDMTSNSEDAVQLIKDLLPAVNQISYCQVREGGTFQQILTRNFSGQPKVVTTAAYEKTQILDAIKQFFLQGN
jgi:uncharacterized sporulation protein YeaH/YhbH (DUF444 family)